jgi:hypothetical protein
MEWMNGARGSHIDSSTYLKLALFLMFERGKVPRHAGLALTIL